MTAPDLAAFLAAFLTARLDDDEVTVTTGECRCEADAPRPDCPERVLADIDAKRRIIGDENDGAALYAIHEAGYWNPDLTRFADEVLRLLALPYADHPDYDAERWAV